MHAMIRASMIRASMMAAAATATLTSTGCLDPLVSDKPMASANLLKKGTVVPLASGNADLKSQIANHDGINDADPTTIPLLTSQIDGSTTINYWSFGAMTTAPSPMYMLVDDKGALCKDHPPFVDALPGDPAYSAIHTLFNVQTTGTYQGEIITTSQALADAIDLGLVLAPVLRDPLQGPNNMTIGRHQVSPIVLPDTKIALTPDPMGNTASTTTVYGHGVAAGMFVFGGPAGEQPGSFIQPTDRVSYLREPAGDGSYNVKRPIFQAKRPPEADSQMLPAGPGTDYIALSVGTVVPTSVRVVPVHETLISIHPEWRGHSYFVVEDDIIIVDSGYRIVKLKLDLRRKASSYRVDFLNLALKLGRRLE